MKKISIAVASVALLAGTAQAAELGYTFVDIGYDMPTLDAGGTDIDGDQYVIEGSFAINEMLFVEGGYNGAEFEESGVEATSDSLFLGVGGHWAMTPNADFVVAGGFVSNDTEVAGFSDDDTGFYLRPGVRGLVGENVELFLDAEYVDIYDDSSTTTYLGGRYHVNDRVAVTAQYFSGDDVDGFGIGARFSF